MACSELCPPDCEGRDAYHLLVRRNGVLLSAAEPVLPTKATHPWLFCATEGCYAIPYAAGYCANCRRGRGA